MELFSYSRFQAILRASYDLVFGRFYIYYAMIHSFSYEKYVCEMSYEIGPSTSCDEVLDNLLISLMET